MIRLSNGHEITFVCAAGALNFHGLGYWWEKPIRWLGYLRPQEFTIISKTLTLQPRKGNLRWWCPWRCVKLVPGGAVNAVGLTNPGLAYWIANHYPVAIKNKLSMICSIAPQTCDEAFTMANSLNYLYIARASSMASRTGAVVGVEANISCPNVSHTGQNATPVEILSTLRRYLRLPLIVKLGVDMLPLVTQLDSLVDSFDVINAIPWSHLQENHSSNMRGRSPLDLGGAVSGLPICEIARKALITVRSLTQKPIISGGGIFTLDEVIERERLGANAFSLGTLFLRQPWKPNQIVREYFKNKRVVGE